MKIRSILIYVTCCLFCLSACNRNKAVLTQNDTIFSDAKSDIVDTLIIAFGSCNDEDKDQPLWNDIMQDQPDLWIWLGDNIYGDTDDMKVMAKKYSKQNNNPAYKKLVQQTRINGVWDDHDYGVNDGGKEYAQKAASQQLLLDFLNVPNDDPRRQREGTYSAEQLVCGSQKVKIFYLDTRYFRDAISRPTGTYLPNFEGTMLGLDQWAWLEEEFRNSDADLHVLVSSIQVIAEDHKWEKWSNFPNERKRLLDLLAKYNNEKTIILSGDRHVAEISRLKWNGVSIVDVTSSSLTNKISKKRPEFNQHRIPGTDLEFENNYGVLELICSDKKELQVSARIKTRADKTSYRVMLD